MKYVSIDIETTGMDCAKNQMIQFGAVIEDTDNVLPVEELPTFDALLLHYSYVVDPFCLDFHAKLYDKMGSVKGVEFECQEKDNVTSVVTNVSKSPQNLEILFKIFLKKNGIDANKKIIVAGKNFTGFDAGWVKPAMPGLKFHHRVLDPVTLFVKDTDTQPPNLKQCAERANVSFKADGYHTAVSDAIMVIELLRSGWNLEEK